MADDAHVSRGRRAGESAALVRRVVDEACNAGDLGVLDGLLPRAALLSRM
jgi:hypothetical protein